MDTPPPVAARTNGGQPPYLLGWILDDDLLLKMGANHIDLVDLAIKWRKANMEEPFNYWYCQRNGHQKVILQIGNSSTQESLDLASTPDYIDRAKNVYGIDIAPAWYRRERDALLIF
ncbi:hypothetical protein BT69DRAFT_1386412 [Atractiella rhizophila]|nr:hypothetical protein BT69DRAFT_1386412 [Atractiella rhizophila]